MIDIAQQVPISMMTYNGCYLPNALCTSIYPPSSSFTPAKSSLALIPKPRGEVGCVGCGGYMFKNVLEQEHRKLCWRKYALCERIFGHVPCLFCSSSKIRCLSHICLLRLARISPDYLSGVWYFSLFPGETVCMYGDSVR